MNNGKSKSIECADLSSEARNLLRGPGRDLKSEGEKGFRIAVEFVKFIWESYMSGQGQHALNVIVHIEEYKSGLKSLPEIVDDILRKIEQARTKDGPNNPDSAKNELYYRRELYFLAQRLREERITHPDNLTDWLLSETGKTILNEVENNQSRRISRGRRRQSTRNDAFRQFAGWLTSFGFPRTRCIDQRGEEYKKCCFQGGSCADVIGVAYYELTGTERKFKTIADII